MKISGRRLMNDIKNKQKQKNRKISKKYHVDSNMKEIQRKWNSTRKKLLNKHGMSATRPKSIDVMVKQIKMANKTFKL